MVEVFKTNINDQALANKIACDLHNHFPGGKINFDLDDCDKILRIENDNVHPIEVTKILKHKGFLCEVLE